MREIKFRAWDIVRNKMLSNKDLWDIPYNEIFINTPDQRALKIMQYTGLKDKNNIEIYEGDIVRCNNNAEDLHEIRFGEFGVYDDETEELIEKAIGWHIKILDSDPLSKVRPFCYPCPLSKYWVDIIDIEVIGNIYENPELLDGENNE